MTEDTSGDKSAEQIIDETEFIGLGPETPVKIRLHKHQGDDQDLLEKGSVVINCLEATIDYINKASGESVNGFGVGWDSLPEEVDELIDEDMRDHLDKGGHLYLTVPAHAVVADWTEAVVHNLKVNDQASYLNGHIEESGDTSDGDKPDES